MYRGYLSTGLLVDNVDDFLIINNQPQAGQEMFAETLNSTGIGHPKAGLRIPRSTPTLALLTVTSGSGSEYRG